MSDKDLISMDDGFELDVRRYKRISTNITFQRIMDLVDLPKTEEPAV